MAHEHALHAGREIVWALPAGAEVFCAAGVLRLTATPGVPCDHPWLAAPRHLLPGQGWRAERPMLLRLEALQPSRCKLTLETDARPRGERHPMPRKNSLLLWGRRLLELP